MPNSFQAACPCYKNGKCWAGVGLLPVYHEDTDCHIGEGDRRCLTLLLARRATQLQAVVDKCLMALKEAGG